LLDILHAFQECTDYGFDPPHTCWQTTFVSAIARGVIGDEALDFYTDRASVRARFDDDLGIKTFRPRQSSARVEYLVDGFLPLRGVNMFVALPETLKTSTA
jgi:hypothetical protein